MESIDREKLSAGVCLGMTRIFFFLLFFSALFFLLSRNSSEHFTGTEVVPDLHTSL